MTEPLYKKLSDDALEWRRAGWPCADYPLIGEILRWQFAGDEFDEGAIKYLRKPQFRALEVYWHLRLARKTPHIISLYREIYGGDKREFFDALGVRMSEDALDFAEIDSVLERIKTNPDYVRKNRLDALNEAVTLAYPSYIFALAMGAGKTVLIGAIAATEFAMSFEYPEAKARFMKNVLVFAPGTTILESLRELQDVPYENILPPMQHKKFLANIKLEYPRTGAKEIQAQKGSAYNFIVTNTEKISLRANTRRRGRQSVMEFKTRKKQEELTANLRLQRIVSLPNLGVFSDEAHHTYGNAAGEELKRMRETVNYINRKPKIVAVINTTGTPYYNRELLKEVVVWYGLGEGIDDNILKSLRDDVARYDLKNPTAESEIIRNIIEDFFERYGDVSLSEFGKAKIAFYFKTQEHLDTTRVYLEESLIAIGEAATQILVNTQKSGKQEIDEFNRLDSPESQKRVILLVGKGTEGWNCRSLFATALIKGQAGGTFVLQAATRCLRQVSGNDKPARVYLDCTNAEILDKQLQDNFRTDLGIIAGHDAVSKEVEIRILKFGAKLPKLEITKTRKRVVRNGNLAKQEIKLAKPHDEKIPAAVRYIFTPTFEGTGSILTPTGETEEIPLTSQTAGCYAAAMRIAANYHLSPMPLLKTLRRFYPDGEMPDAHLYALFLQAEEQTANYEITEEKITEALALIHVHDKNGNPLFKQDAGGVYVHTLRFSRQQFEQIETRRLLVHKESESDKKDVSFHYTPYNFDSRPERDFFAKILNSLNCKQRDISCFLFTGGLTDTAKTDFHFEYKSPDGNYRRYFPDFVIVKNSGEFYAVEVKSEAERHHRAVEAKEKAIQKIAKMQPAKFRYHIVYTPASDVSADAIAPVVKWMREDSKQ